MWWVFAALVPTVKERASLSRYVLAVLVAAAVLLGCEAAPGVDREGSPAPAPESQRALLERAQKEFLAGNYPSAGNLFARVWARDEGSFEAMEGMVRCYEAMGEVRTLVEQLWSRARRSPSTATVEYGLGLTQLLLGKFEQAQAHLNRALELAPGNPWVLYARGELFRAVGSDDAARSDFQAVLRKNPRHGPSLAALAILAYRRDRDPTQAAGLLEQAVTHFRPIERSQQVAAYVFLGRLYASAREYDKALERFRAARRLDLAATYALVDIGGFLADLGRSGEAEREWDATLKELGADSPVGLDILRSRRRRAGDLVDLTHVLGGAPPAQYQSLLAHVGAPQRLPALRVDEVLKPYIPPFRDVLIDTYEDLDGDGERERLVVDAVQTDRAFPDQFLVAEAVLRLFSSKRTEPYVLPTHYEHLYKFLVRDLDGDGFKEVLLAGFRETNKLTVMVVSRLPRGYGLSLAASVVCSTPWAGCLITDLDGDGRREMLFISGEDGWVDIYRWRGSQPRLADADFPEFYQAFLARWSGTSASELDRRPDLREKLRRARSFNRSAGSSRPAAD